MPPLIAWSEYAGLLQGADWPDIDALNARRCHDAIPHFAAQDRVLLDDDLHYEQRIAERGIIATRERNWHDLFNALVWLRYPALKQALNRRQVEEIARMGPRERSRPQCAMTHFDEAGVIVRVADPSLLARWDAHDWHGLFWRERAAWQDGRIDVAVFGHALLEHALTPGKLLVGKALVVVADAATAWEPIVAGLAQRVTSGALLRDPLELRPLPLSGIPGWHPDNGDEAFHRQAPCYQPRRPGRAYPPPWVLPEAAASAAVPTPTVARIAR
ncbi:MAG: DUF3025 domain-containing protein [Xanthomonadaceae bacterium]|nr:DUF3025 domain-containing protein [Xanthomonadaceae bacterium]MDE1963432.1 DUF3025 domain-containing protein [Xanthomonadaceae bacterium]